MKSGKSGFFNGPLSRQIDDAVRRGLPISGFDLMQRAARAALTVIMAEYPHARHLLIVCGKGNNGGDGYLIGALAKEHGLDASIIALASPDELQDDAARAYRAADDANVAVSSTFAELNDDVDVVVDAMLGTGFSGEPRPVFAEVITALNELDRPVVAVDIPSGVNASSGDARHAVQAEHTVTFITQKIGMATGPGKTFAGKVHFCDLGVPEQLYPPPLAYPCLWYKDALSDPAATAYKHQQGHVLIAGGDLGMPGAVTMAAEAALRVGAGMVTVATRAEHAQALLARVPEAMTIDPDVADFAEGLTRFDLIVLGPGLGRQAWGEALYTAVAGSSVPVVLDADGLFWLAQKRDEGWSGGALSMTPHSAEAARLLDCSVAELEADRIAAAEALAKRFGARVNLKGPGSVLQLVTRCEICMHGNPGMATAGMGDVLSGIAGGIMAAAYRQQMSDEKQDDLFSAAVALHSYAADRAAHEVGLRSLIATDVIRALPQAIQGDRG